MAIQMRRGDYGDFISTKMVAGEWAVCQSGDPNTSGGRSVYICFEPGVVKRIVTVEDFEAEFNTLADEFKAEFTEEVQQAIKDALAATEEANEAAEKASSAASEATAAAESGIKSAEVTYQASSSGTTTPTGTWSSSIPSVADGNYLWTRVVITQNNGATITFYSVGYKGESGGESGKMFYGSSSTAAGTAAKTVACDGFTLDTGSQIAVTFTITNTASSPTLNVNSTGAKQVYYQGARYTGFTADHTYLFVYDGTYYQIVGDIDTDTKTLYGTSSTAASTTAKVVSCDGFVLDTGAMVAVTFSVTNTASSPTMNVNSTGAKSVYYQGSRFTGFTADHTYLFVYDGTYYQIVGDIYSAAMSYTESTKTLTITI